MIIVEATAMVAAALFAGGALYVSAVEHPARLQGGADVAVREFRASYARATVWQGGMALLAAATCAVAALWSGEWLWLLGGACIGAAVPWTMIVMLPVNRRLYDELSDEETVRLLSRWGALHMFRSAASLVGLCAIAVAALW
jgi:hypothetical protein